MSRFASNFKDLAYNVIHATLEDMNRRFLPLVFSATLFLSAFLIFAIQPMVSKMLLPMLGGSASVWNTAMVFFQAMLLAGYAYAHIAAKFMPLKMQAIFHIALLCVFALVLPLTLPDDLTPPEDAGQAVWQLGVMLACIGGPFFVLAASAPLFQHWFAACDHEESGNPYFLYAVSNAGSMLALLSYPLVIEPLLSVSRQSWIWFAGYLALIILTFVCACFVKGGKGPLVSAGFEEEHRPVSWLTRAIWVGLAFVPSSLMLGVTAFITTDLTSAPFLWVLPLAIYLVTFIIAFSPKPFLPVALTRELAAYAISFVIMSFMLGVFVNLRFPMMLIHLGTFFLCAMLCHGELARARPSTLHLTEYFLLISLGGVLGGIFNALVAPNLFLIPLEYSLVLSTIGFVIWAGTARVPVISSKFNAIDHKTRQRKLFLIDIFTVIVGLVLFGLVFFTQQTTLQAIGTLGIFAFFLLMAQNRFVFAVTAFSALMIFQPMWNSQKTLIALDRNYFGVLKVYSQADTHFFYHGTTIHGAQPQADHLKKKPVTYYNPQSPAFDIFTVMNERFAPQKIAALGLGVGSIACFQSKGREFDFYEIDKDVVDIAENPAYFSYLSGCGSPYKIILGDARLKIAQTADRNYDLVFIDVFSSDNIPVHIMTKEAMATYLDKLTSGGIIAFNISNRYLDLRPVLTSIAEDLGLTIYFKHSKPEQKKGDVSELYTESLFAVLAPNPESIATFVEDYNWAPYIPEKKPRAWTDDYADILSSMMLF